MKNHTRSSSDYTIAVVDDAVRLLELFLDGAESHSLAQLTQLSGLSKTKTFRILATLEKHRLVEREESGAYRLGIRFLSFGRHVEKELSLLEASRSVMDWLVQETRESVFLGVLDGGEALCVGMRESPQSLRFSVEVGQRVPLYLGGVPKVLLAFLPEQEREMYLENMQFEPITPHTITSVHKLRAVLQQIRRQGYAVTADDLDEGVHSIAAPIRDHHGQVIAAISIAGPSNRFTEDRIRRYIELVQEGAAQISRALGNQGAQG